MRIPLAGHSSGRTDVCDSSLNLQTGCSVVFTILSIITCQETALALSACLLQIGGVPEAMARHLFQEMMVAVDYCHRLGIVNRDIKVNAWS